MLAAATSDEQIATRNHCAGEPTTVGGTSEIPREPIALTYGL